MFGYASEPRCSITSGRNLLLHLISDIILQFHIKYLLIIIGNYYFMNEYDDVCLTKQSVYNFYNIFIMFVFIVFKGQKKLKTHNLRLC